MRNTSIGRLRMNDTTWKRHASPWSVWTRFSTLPVLALAVWSRVWIGPYAWVFVALLVAWLIVNPMAFPPPKHTNRWGNKATFGERVWLNREKIAIPQHHARAATVLGAITAVGVPFFGYGLYALDAWPVLFGMCVIYLGKMWFLDRMVWLFEDMKDADPEYRSWLY